MYWNFWCKLRHNLGSGVVFLAQVGDEVQCSGTVGASLGTALDEVQFSENFGASLGTNFE